MSDPITYTQSSRYSDIKRSNQSDDVYFRGSRYDTRTGRVIGPGGGDEKTDPIDPGG